MEACKNLNDRTSRPTDNGHSTGGNHRLPTSFSSVSTGGPLFIEGSLGSTKLNDQP